MKDENLTIILCGLIYTYITWGEWGGTCPIPFHRRPIYVCLEEYKDCGAKDGTGLAESLGLADVIDYGISCTVGAGIYSIGVATDCRYVHTR